MQEQEESWQNQLGSFGYSNIAKEEDQEDVQNPKGMMIVNGNSDLYG